MILKDKYFRWENLPVKFQNKLKMALEGMGAKGGNGADLLGVLKDGVDEIAHSIFIFDRKNVDRLTMQTLLMAMLILECVKMKNMTTDLLNKLFIKNSYMMSVLFNEEPVRIGEAAKDMIRQSIAIGRRKGADIVDICLLIIIAPILSTINYTIYRLNKVVHSERSKKYAKLIADLYENAAQESGEDNGKFAEILSSGGRYQGFAAVAYGAGYPLLETGKEELINPEWPNVMIYGMGEDLLDLAKEIDRQGGANMMILYRYQIDMDGKNISVSSAVLYKNGRLYLVDFSKPIRPNYFFQPHPTGETCRAIERARIPSAGSPEVSWITENKEICRHIGSKTEGAHIPHVFWSARKNEKKKHYKKLGLSHEESSDPKEVKRRLERFCKENGCSEIVVKPSNANQGFGVKFFKSTELKAAAREVGRILEKGFGVMIEKRIVAAPLVIDGQRKDWNLRVFVTLNTENNGSIITIGDILARVDTPGKPVNISISAKVMTLPDILDLMKVSEEERKKLMTDIDKIVEDQFIAIYKFIVDYFNMSPYMDLLGIDIIIAKEKGKLVPYVLEVNDHMSGGMHDLSKILPPHEQGRASRKLAAWMIKQAKIHKDILSKHPL